MLRRRLQRPDYTLAARETPSHAEVRVIPGGRSPWRHAVVAACRQALAGAGGTRTGARSDTRKAGHVQLYLSAWRRGLDPTQRTKYHLGRLCNNCKNNSWPHMIEQNTEKHGGTSSIPMGNSSLCLPILLSRRCTDR